MTRTLVDFSAQLHNQPDKIVFKDFNAQYNQPTSDTSNVPYVSFEQYQKERVGGNIDTGGHNYGGFWILLVWATFIIFAIWIIKVFIVWIVREFIGKKTLDILKERYVRGEIDKKEFEEKLKDIKNS